MRQAKYYIADRDVVLGSANLFEEFHFIDLPNGQVLVSVVCGRGGHLRFERHCSVDPLPERHNPQPINKDQAAKLAHLGIKSSDTTDDVSRVARTINQLMV